MDAASVNQEMRRKLNDEQWDIAHSFDKPLFVAAGAGSGKTHTLTQRVIYGLVNKEIDSVDNILVVTFTEKAAAEIKERIRGELIRVGLKEEALKVDGAWISTIHGMCSRILKESAFEIGLDPEFVVLGEHELDELCERAIQKSLRQFQRQGKTPELLSAYEIARPLGSRGAEYTLFSMIKRYIQAASLAPYELDSMLSVPSEENLSVQVLEAAEHEYTEEKQQEWAELLVLNKQFERIAQAAYKAFKEEKWENGHGLDNNDLLGEALKALRNNSEVRERYQKKFQFIMVDEYQDTSRQQIDMIRMLIEEGSERKLVTVGDAQQSIYRFRGADVSVFNDSQKKTERIDPHSLKILNTNYRSHKDILRFVMQVCDGAGGFGVIPDFPASSDLRAKEDIPQKEIAEEARKTHEKNYACAPGSRIFVEAAVGGSSIEGKSYLAKAMAKRFAWFHEQGQSYADMALLVNTNTGMADYIEALRAEGIPCVVSGGSSFSKASEVAVIMALLHALAQPYDTESGLFPVLSSEMFELQDEDFCEIKFGGGVEGGHAPREMADYFRRRLAHAEGGRASFALKRAEDLLCWGWGKLAYLQLGEIVSRIIYASGWISRLSLQGVEGQACIANIIDMVESIKSLVPDMSMGPVRAVHTIDAWLASVKKGPASLTGDSKEALQIMTIHASKGLQFRVVGIAGSCADPRRDTSYLKMATFGPYVFWTLGKSGLKELKDTGERVRGINKDMLRSFMDQPHINLSQAVQKQFDLLTYDDWRVFLKIHDEEEEKAEAARKLYVALTRAEEALILNMHLTNSMLKPESEAFAPHVLSAIVSQGEAQRTKESYREMQNGGVSLVEKQKYAFSLGSFEDAEEDFIVDKLSPYTKEDIEDRAFEFGGAQRGAYPLLLSVKVLQKEEENQVEENETAEDFSVVSDKELEGNSGRKEGRLPDTEREDKDRSDGEPRFKIRGFEEEVFSYSKMQRMDKTHLLTKETNGLSAESVKEVDSINKERETNQEEEKRVIDSNKATSFGSAFHLCAQYYAETRTIPEIDRIKCIARACGIETMDDSSVIQNTEGCQQKGFKDLLVSFERWCASKLCYQAFSYPCLRAEIPFFIKEESVYGSYLRGAIDLLGCDNGSQTAFLVDYKTGDLDCGHNKELFALRHERQAKVYAHVLFHQGFKEVYCTFVAVQLIEEDNQPLSVCYFYNEDPGLPE